MLLTFILLINFLILAGLCIYLSIKLDKQKVLLEEKERLQKQRLYEVTILKTLQERIGYSLDVEKVLDTLTGSLKNLFTYSTASAVLIKPDKISIKTYIEENVSSAFLEGTKKSMLASIAILLDKPLPKQIDETRVGLITDTNKSTTVASFFHVPIIVNGEIVGLINVSSTKPGLYKESEMTVMYQMTQQASNALSKLKEVIEIEQGKLVAMITSLADGIIMLDANSNLTLINNAAKQLLDISKPDLNVLDIVSLLPKEFNFPQKLHAVLTGTGSTHQEELMMKDKTLEIYMNPITAGNQDGKVHIIGAAILLHDITLEKSLAEMKENFTHGIVHELRSPLTAIKSSTELINQEKNLTAEQQKFLGIIHKQTLQMLDDINSLLDAAKMESGKFSIDQKATDLSQLITEKILFYQHESEEKHIKLIDDIDPHLPPGNIDAVRIGQVINNLLSNSLKFTHSGGSIAIKAALIWDHIQPISSMNPCITVSVSDNGIGIPEEKQHVLFNKFIQVKNPTVYQEKGSGLGLFITKGIVQAHGGAITLTSKEGQGTTISFTIPVTRAKNLVNQEVKSKVYPIVKTSNRRFLEPNFN